VTWHKGDSLSRRTVVSAIAGAFGLSRTGLAAAPDLSCFSRVQENPDSLLVFDEQGSLELKRTGQRWTGDGIELRLGLASEHTSVNLVASRPKLLRLRVRWLCRIPERLAFLGDQWERSYGDLAWRGMDPERILPWYFLASDGASTAACGVETAASAFCFWQTDPDGVSLWLDIRNGGAGVQLAGRELPLANIVARRFEGREPFSAGQAFCKLLSPHPRLPQQPVYGGNNWYYAYGKSSSQDILDDSERMAWCAADQKNRPWMVIDDGWQPNPTAGPWDRGNAAFPDMADLATRMRQKGVQPGIWMRPLYTKESLPASWALRSPGASRQGAREGGMTLDPTVADVHAKVQKDVRTIANWNYGLIKHDFSTFDFFGHWGFSMGASITDSEWHFNDESRTNAEIIRAFYASLREAAEDKAMLLGCNTVGHLAAGLFELQRTGDDTSGRDWNRTRKMGVNTLAFRAIQHDSFFAIDADCVGLTKQISWHLNRQWLELLSASGTPLFVSLSPDAFESEQKTALRHAFSIAAEQQPVGQPLDWMSSTDPARWRLRGEIKNFDWFGAPGPSPFLS
jgi:alpha-galactosidase